MGISGRGGIPNLTSFSGASVKLSMPVNASTERYSCSVSAVISGTSESCNHCTLIVAAFVATANDPGCAPRYEVYWVATAPRDGEVVKLDE